MKKKTPRTKYSIGSIKVNKTYAIDDTKIIHKNATFTVINIKDFKDNHWHPKTIYTIERILNISAIKKLLLKEPTEPQLKQLQEVCDRMNSGEVFTLEKTIPRMINGGVDTHFVRRLRLLSILNAGDTLLCYFIHSGKEFRGIHKKEKIDIVRGSNNPAFGHAGKFSPFSKKFIKYEGLSEEEMNSKIEKVCVTSGISQVVNGNNPHCRSFKGYEGMSEDEITLALREKNKTFSLSICIEKHGIIEGMKIWQDRQEKWQTTLNSKTIEAKIEMNLKKSAGFKNSMLNKSEGTIYYIRFYNEDTEFWKIGFTTKTIRERFNSESIKAINNLNYEVLYELKDTPINCYSKEQDLLSKFKAYRFRCNYNGFKTNEAFNENIITLSDMIEADINHTRTFRFRNIKFEFSDIQPQEQDASISKDWF